MRGKPRTAMHDRRLGVPIAVLGVPSPFRRCLSASRAASAARARPLSVSGQLSASFSTVSPSKSVGVAERLTHGDHSLLYGRDFVRRPVCRIKPRRALGKVTFPKEVRRPYYGAPPDGSGHAGAHALALFRIDGHCRVAGVNPVTSVNIRQRIVDVDRVGHRGAAVQRGVDPDGPAGHVQHPLVVQQVHSTRCTPLQVPAIESGTESTTTSMVTEPPFEILRQRSTGPMSLETLLLTGGPLVLSASTRTRSLRALK